jgi:hypothetical protein
VNDDHLLRKPVVPNQVSEPVDHKVYLGCFDRSDLLEMDLVGPETPLRV